MSESLRCLHCLERLIVVWRGIRWTHYRCPCPWCGYEVKVYRKEA